MYYDRKKEYRNFLIEFAAQKKLMQKAGMGEEEITAMFKFDKAVFNRNRSFDQHRAEFVTPDDDGNGFPDQKKNKRKYEEPPKEFWECFSFLDTVDDKLHSAFGALSDNEREVLILSYVRDLPMQQIAVLMGISYESIRQHHSRALKKIKKFL